MWKKFSVLELVVSTKGLQLVLNGYSALCVRLYNSSGLLEETKLALYMINHTTLVSGNI